MIRKDEYRDSTLDPNSVDIRPLRLDPLKSLRRLKIVSFNDWCSIANFRNELTLMRIILASSTSPVHIRSVILETSLGSLYPWENVATSPTLVPDKWLPIDRILASPKFVDLHTVEVRVNRSMHHYVGPSEIPLDPGGEFDFSGLLPAISSHPRISLITSMM